MTKVCESCKARKPLRDFQLAPADGRAKLPPPSRKCLDCIKKLWREKGFA